MPTLYIDHSIVSNESLWPAVEKAVSSGSIRLVLSLWNLFEIGAHADLGLQEKRLSFLESLHPLWAVERLPVQRQELKRFLWKRRFDAPVEDLQVITPLLSVVDSYLTGSQVRIGLTPRRFIAETDFPSLIPLKKLTPDALRTLQNVDAATKKIFDRQMFDAWIRALLPDFDTEGCALTLQQKADLLQFCWDQRKDMFVECPCIAVEDRLFAARTRDPGRNPTDSDSVDLQHAVVALAYTDLFFTRDGYQAACAKAARKDLAPAGLAEICQTSEALESAVELISPSVEPSSGPPTE